MLACASAAVQGLQVGQAAPRPVARGAATMKDPFAFTLGVVGDLHMDPRDLDDSFEGRSHIKKILDEAGTPGSTYVCSLGDLGESKDCTQTQQLFAGTTPCFELVRDFLDGFGHPYDIVGGNHDLEGIDEFATDEENLEAYLSIMGKETPQYCHQVADKTLIVGIGSTVFRGAKYTSHEVFVDKDQCAWFEKTITDHPAEDGWRIFVFSHAPIIGSGLRVLQECHVVNGCCWLNHNDAQSSKNFIEIVRNNPSIKAWFSGHFHLSHDYEDSITFPGGSNRGSCVFAQVGCMTTRSTRDGKRHSRIVKGTKDGFEICTINHKKGGELRLDATVTYDDASHESIVMAHPHEDYDHDLWFQAYTPAQEDGCYISSPAGVLNADGTWDEKTVCWWHMSDGAVLGVHDGMIIEYDASTLAPLGMVVSKDELAGRKVAVIDAALNPPCDGAECDVPKEQALVLYDDGDEGVTVVQPNEDGSYWRKIVRNKMHRMREQRRVKAAAKWFKDKYGDDKDPEVLSSWGPYTSTVGQVYRKNDLALPAISTRALDSSIPK
uniref:Calcineurin-like phosphoesterase domain-containing protein n=1 Tax=Emiliania huxleyi TaxID=2903 RepID=A0A7S3T7E8_EMIHU|mmetsp:Transcript_6580/g.20489  ORF Transcript_6580/g.20489 Transcript_6580/m.20489 type:complete len:549 (-) Transcript_6580:328-1974(-)